MKCNNCNQELPENAKFCFSCGAKVGNPFCMNCGAKVVEGAKFCMMCGASLSSETKRAEPEYVKTERTEPEYAETERTEPEYAETERAEAIPNLSVSVNLQTGTTTLFRAASSGKLTVSESGVSYVKSFGSASSHTYAFADIQNTEFKMTRTGLQPWFGYKIHLKNGTVYTYIYSPFLKSKMVELDQAIRSQLE